MSSDRAWGAQACQAASASLPLENGHLTMNQATFGGTGCSRKVKLVTTPKLPPPPPRSAQ